VWQLAVDVKINWVFSQMGCLREPKAEQRFSVVYTLSIAVNHCLSFGDWFYSLNLVATIFVGPLAIVDLIIVV